MILVKMAVTQTSIRWVSLTNLNRLAFDALQYSCCDCVHWLLFLSLYSLHLIITFFVVAATVISQIPIDKFDN